MANAPIQPRHLAQQLLGKSAVEACGWALTFGYHLRVVQEDGKSLGAGLTEDYDPKRWDIEIQNGLIVGLRIPGPPTPPPKK
jgi:hypothetical protein